MKQPYSAFFAVSACLLSAPLFAQPSIGGGTCSTSTLNGNYAVTLTGRGVTASQLLTGTAVDVRRDATLIPAGAAVTSAFQALGTVSFDGLSKASFTLVANTNKATGTAVSWSGTYTVEANCAAAVSISSGGTASLNVMPSNNGKAFILTGGDSTYAYSGSGSTLAVGCSTSTLTGVYATTTTQGYVGMTQSSVGGAATATGIAQFDGQGNASATESLSGNGILAGATATETGPFTGTYSLGSNCIGSGTLTNALSQTVPINFVVYTVSSTLGSPLSTQFYLMTGSSPPSSMGIGNAYWIDELPQSQGQPGAALHHPWHALHEMWARLFSGKPRKGEAA